MDRVGSNDRSGDGGNRDDNRDDTARYALVVVSIEVRINGIEVRVNVENRVAVGIAVGLLHTAELSSVDVEVGICIELTSDVEVVV